MANTIELAKKYIENPFNLADLVRTTAYTADLEKEWKGDGKGAISVKVTKVTKSAMGDFSFESGLPLAAVSVTWEDRVPTQDKGDTIRIDKLENVNQYGDTLVASYNDYMRRLAIPTVDAYRFGKLKSVSGAKKVVDAALTKSSVEGAIDAAIDYLSEKGVKSTAAVVCYISTPTARLLKSATADKKSITEGAWNGQVDNLVSLYGDNIKVKLVEVPSSLLEGVNFIVTPISAFDAVAVNRASLVREDVQGFAGRVSQIETNIVHDAWAAVGGEEYIYISSKA